VYAAAPTTAISELIAGWYDEHGIGAPDLGPGGPDQVTSFVPDGWSGEEVVYREVVKPYCRGCHVALSDPPAAFVDFDNYPEFEAFATGISDEVCERRDMPDAQVTREKFWQSPARGHLIGRLNLPTPCS